MKKFSCLFAVFLSLSLSSSLSANDVLEELKKCVQIADQNDRLSCYDALGQRALTEKHAPVTSIETQAPTAPAEPTVEVEEALSELPDSIGGGEYADAAGIKKKSYRGHVKECRKSSDRKWFYIFENGQVWKQVDRRKRRHKNCDFDVVLTEDNFGYVMQIEGDDSNIRVDRRR